MTDDDVIMTLDKALERCRELEGIREILEAKVSQIESDMGVCECCGRRVPSLYVINLDTHYPREFCKYCYRGYNAGIWDKKNRSVFTEWVLDNPILAGATFGSIVGVVLLIAHCVGVI